MTQIFFLATLFGSNSKLLFGPDDSLMREVLILIGSVGLVSSVILIWAVFFRKHHRHHQSRRRHQTHAVVERAHSRWKARRHRRREHRPRNPTLAETGGLPPVRVESSTEHSN